MTIEKVRKNKEFQVLYAGMKDRAIDLGKIASSSDIIFDALRDEIINGNLKAGESIRQEYIAKIFNVSRIPVREALKRLEAQGLVKNERYKGVIVSSLSDDEIEEIFEIRRNLEPLVLKYSIENMTQETLELARKYCDAFGAEEDSSKWGDLNRQFHETLYRDCQRPYHLKIIGEAIDRIDSYIRAQLVLTKGMGTAVKEHTEILNACEKGDAERAAALTHKHIAHSYSSLMGYLRKQNKD
ncbi:GntR family transcriptional regulator [Sneathiella sp.]|uniref:GntR family transcriptional regulator n=1 Tax=Sneathiella sp. TaxID=1964365 RepID=UPI0039E3B375